MFKQIRDADMKVGYVGGWCLKYVQDAFGTDHPYATAIDSWNSNYGNGNHPGELPPMGITVPVYFSLGNVPAGHVAIRLDDGMVASSTQAGAHPTPYFHKDINDLVAVYGKYNGGCTYLGWSEDVGTVRVVAPAQVNATDDEINQAYREILDRPDGADAGGLATYRNFTIDFVRNALMNSPERQTVLANRQAKADAIVAAQAAADAKVKADADAAAQAQADAKARQDAIDKQAIADAAVQPTPPVVPPVTPVPEKPVIDTPTTSIPVSTQPSEPVNIPVLTPPIIDETPKVNKSAIQQFIDLLVYIVKNVILGVSK